MPRWRSAPQSSLRRSPPSLCAALRLMRRSSRSSPAGPRRGGRGEHGGRRLRALPRRQRTHQSRLARCRGAADAAVLGSVTRDPAFVLAWLAVAAPPMILARLLLAVVNGSRRTLINVAVNDRGPVLVIGGAGYIGTHAVEQLLAPGHAVRVLDRLMYGDESLRDFVRHPRFEFIEGDAADISKLTVALRGASAVVHLAGLVGDPACAVDPEFTRHTNIVVTRMVRTVAYSMGIRRFVFASSCSVYGVSDDPVNELSPLSPVSLYAQTKIDSERELLSNVPDNFFTTILRFATVFGHSRRPRFDLVGEPVHSAGVERRRDHGDRPRPMAAVRSRARPRPRGRGRDRRRRHARAEPDLQRRRRTSEHDDPAPRRGGASGRTGESAGRDHRHREPAGPAQLRGLVRQDSRHPGLPCGDDAEGRSPRDGALPPRAARTTITIARSTATSR